MLKMSFGYQADYTANIYYSAASAATKCSFTFILYSVLIQKIQFLNLVILGPFLVMFLPTK
jgi:hypothetical protein